VAVFLSDEWIEALAAAAAHATPALHARVAIRQVVGDVAWTVRVADGAISVDRDEAADLTLHTDAGTAAALARGELAAADALAAGRLRLSGDLSVLLDASGGLAGLDAAYAGVRASTEFA
jgi:predicted lipid carrier protein YhbT